MSSPAHAVAEATVLQRWAPGLKTLRHYQRYWLFNDVMAGLVLTAVLIGYSGHSWP